MEGSLHRARPSRLPVILAAGALVLGVLAMAPAPTARAAPGATGPSEEVVITFGGDLCLNRNQLVPESEGTRWGKKLLRWEWLTRHLAPLLDGDLNFGNIETVVTDRKRLPREDKAYTFQSHPDGIRHLVKIGFNPFSLANNHVYDYGAEGVRETVKHMAAIAKETGIHYAGQGLDRDQAAAPVVFLSRGHRIAFGAIGGITNMNPRHRAGKGKPGSLGYRFGADWKLFLDLMAKTEADYKIISVHTGVERQTRLDRGQRKKWHGALERAGVDLIIGHHPHVVRGIEAKGRKLAFYSMGNYLIRGARNMGPLPDHQDYGLFGRVYLSHDPATGRLVAQAAEVVPLTDMHVDTSPLRADEAQKRLAVLNAQSRKSLGQGALIFEARPDGSGIACFGDRLGKRASKACARATSGK